jgi:hypothetical protein
MSNQRPAGASCRHAFAEGEHAASIKPAIFGHCLFVGVGFSVVEATIPA